VYPEGKHERLEAAVATSVKAFVTEVVLKE